MEAPGEAAITEKTTTLVVNAHGALISLAMKVKPGTRIFVRNRAVADDKECRVLRIQEQHQGQNEVTVEFLRPDAKFPGTGISNGRLEVVRAPT
jgi:hypothetical protein